MLYHPSAISVWYIRCARVRSICYIEAWESSLGRFVINAVCGGCAQYTDYGLTYAPTSHYYQHTGSSAMTSYRSLLWNGARNTLIDVRRMVLRVSTICQNKITLRAAIQMTSRTPLNTPSKRAVSQLIQPSNGDIIPNVQHATSPSESRLNPPKKDDPTHRLGRFELPILQA
jgi:hypothetical protein